MGKGVFGLEGFWLALESVKEYPHSTLIANISVLAP